MYFSAAMEWTPVYLNLNLLWNQGLYTLFACGKNDP
jgi:hypothetical protein